MPESSPPKTPAMHIGRSAEQIIRSSAVSFRSTPSNVTKGVPSAQVRTTTSRPSIFAASNACRGLPQLEEHEVGDIDQIVLGVDARGAQAVLHPLRRRAYLAVLHRHARVAGVASWFSTRTVTGRSWLSGAKAETSGIFTSAFRP